MVLIYSMMCILMFEHRPFNDEDEHRWISISIKYREEALHYDDIQVTDKAEVLKFGSGTIFRP